MTSTALLWYRRDLRLHDHPALWRATHEFERVVPVFVLDDALLHGRFSSGPRAAFALGCLRALDAELRDRGSGLVLRHGRPEDELGELCAQAGAEAVLWTSDVAPYARARDTRVTAALREAGMRALPTGGTYVVDVSGSRTRAGRPYTVFSPFHRHWLAADRRPVHRAPARLPALPTAVRWGCVSARECEERAGRRGGEGARACVRQLCWRDFFAHVLLWHPANATREHQERYRDLEWVQDGDSLQAWREGRTGYPLVDAAMRQLARTGWMHNRARMVVGSFLTKDLHLDWRLGEAHFEGLLLDGEPAQNNGNWQWIASVGVDPSPYFQRLFNPVLQQRRFDPEGAYVRRWVPELSDVPAERLAEPWTMTDDEQQAAGCVIGRDYPAPIVEHAHERRRAIERYRAAGR